MVSSRPSGSERSGRLLDAVAVAGEEEDERVARTDPLPQRLERRPHVGQRRLLVGQQDRVVRRHAGPLDQPAEDALRVVRRVREIAEPAAVVADAHEQPVGLRARRRRRGIGGRAHAHAVRADLPGAVRRCAHAIPPGRRKARDDARVRVVGAVGVVVLRESLPVRRDQMQHGVEVVGLEVDGQRLAGPAVHDPGVVVAPRVGLRVPFFEPARTRLAHAQPVPRPARRRNDPDRQSARWSARTRRTRPRRTSSRAHGRSPSPARPPRRRCDGFRPRRRSAAAGRGPSLRGGCRNRRADRPHGARPAATPPCTRPRTGRASRRRPAPAGPVRAAPPAAPPAPRRPR